MLESALNRNRNVWKAAMTGEMHHEVRQWEVWALRALIGGTCTCIVTLLAVAAAHLGHISEDIRSTKENIIATNLGLTRLEGENRRIGDKLEVIAGETRQRINDLAGRVERLENHRFPK